MLPSNKSKFNKPSGKTKFFPFKQFRFDVSQHPIILSKSKRSYKIKSILSPQEEQMLLALSSSLNVHTNEAIRIAVSKVCTLDSEEVEKTIPFSIAKSSLRGHTSRSRTLRISLTKEEKDAFIKLAETYKLSEQETLRLAIIHEQKSIRSGTRTEYQNSRMLSQGECWDAWSKDKPVSSGKADAIYKARDQGLEKKIARDKSIYEERGEMMEHLIYSGEYIPRDQSGEIDLGYIDTCIEIERQKENDFAWDFYLAELVKDDRSDRDIQIEKEMFYNSINGLELTRDEAIQLIEERERNILSEEQEYELQQEIDRYLEELEDEHVSEHLGYPISQLSPDDRKRAKQEYHEHQASIARERFKEQKRVKRVKKEKETIESVRGSIRSSEKRLAQLRDLDNPYPTRYETRDDAIKEEEDILNAYKKAIKGKYRHLDQRYPEP